MINVYISAIYRFFLPLFILSRSAPATNTGMTLNPTFRSEAAGGRAFGRTRDESRSSGADSAGGAPCPVSLVRDRPSRPSHSQTFATFTVRSQVTAADPKD